MNHLLALHNFHGSGSDRLGGHLLLLLLLARHESGGGKSENSNLLHNTNLVFGVVSNIGRAGLPTDSAGNIPAILRNASLKFIFSMGTMCSTDLGHAD